MKQQFFFLSQAHLLMTYSYLSRIQFLLINDGCGYYNYNYYAMNFASANTLEFEVLINGCLMAQFAIIYVPPLPQHLTTGNYKLQNMLLNSSTRVSGRVWDTRNYSSGRSIPGSVPFLVL